MWKQLKFSNNGSRSIKCRHSSLVLTAHNLCKDKNQKNIKIKRLVLSADTLQGGIFPAFFTFFPNPDIFPFIIQFQTIVFQGF